MIGNALDPLFGRTSIRPVDSNPPISLCCQCVVLSAGAVQLRPRLIAVTIEITSFIISSSWDKTDSIWQNLTLRLLPSDNSGKLIEPLMDPATIPDYKVSLGGRAGSGIAVRNRRSSSAPFAHWLLSYLMSLLHPGGIIRENKTKQTKRQENAGEGLVRFADQI
jgi:hypothetical protein